MEATIPSSSNSWTARRQCPSTSIGNFLLVIAAFSLSLVPIGCVAAEIGQQKLLRFGKDGEFKILQVADMHYADGKTTPCLNVLPSQVAGCSDLNTSAFIHRMIEAEKPDLIVFTGICSFPIMPLFAIILPYVLSLCIYFRSCLSTCTKCEAFEPLVRGSITFCFVYSSEERHTALRVG